MESQSVEFAKHVLLAVGIIVAVGTSRSFIAGKLRVPFGLLEG